MWFYGGFTPIFSLSRIGKMRRTAEQLQYIMRDEALHVAFGMPTIRVIMEEKNYRPPKENVHQKLSGRSDLCGLHHAEANTWLQCRHALGAGSVFG